VASLVQSGLELRWIAVSQTPYVGITVLTLPVVLPLTACVLAYLAGDAATGTAAGVIATTWLSLGIVQVVAPPHATSGALGLMLIAAASLLALTAASVSIAKPLPALLFFLAALRFALTGVYHLSSEQGFQRASGVLGLILFPLALYSVLAFELEDRR
jgi:succinate-acetate transporter protein